MQGIAQPAIAQINGDIELLKMVADKYRANIDKIKTWKGEVKGFRNNTSGISEWTANYACDFTIPAKRWAITVEKNTNIHDGKETSTPVMLNFGMFHEGAYYDLKYTAPYKDNRHVLAVQDHQFSRPGFMYDVFDPIYFFGYGGTKFDEYFMHLYKNAKEMTGWSIKKEGDYIVLQLVINKYGSIPMMLYNIDLTKGANVTRVESRENETDSKSESIWQWKWKEINGAWVPTEVSRDNIVSLPAPTKVYHNRIVWEKNEVNVALASDEFALQRLGARQGDLIIDTRKNTQTRITDKSFPPEVVIKKKPAEEKSIKGKP